MYYGKGGTKMILSRRIIMLTLITVVSVTILTTGVGLAAPITFKGTVTFVNLEGGFWGIVSEDGKKYDPISLPAEFQHEGLQVQAEGLVQDLMSVHMWGIIIKITSITKIDH